MNLCKGKLIFLLTLVWLNIPTWAAKANENQPTDSVLNCPEPALSRLKKHIVAPGETLESIAGQYNLIPATLLGMNPEIRRGEVRAGSEIVIPPYNGIVVEVPFGENWRDVAASYKVRDILVYEANGCQEDPRIVFLPGVNWSPTGNDGAVADSNVKGYPLPAISPVALGYGWLLHPTTRKVFFHSGLDMIAPPDTPVLAAGDGIVAFAGVRGNYGNLVVLNHQEGQQTRYAHLANIFVTTGQRVRQGEQLGTVGTTGEPDTSSPHLHFEVRYNSDLGWVAEDPKSYIRQAVGGTGSRQPSGNAEISPGQTPKPLVVPPGSAEISPRQTPKPLVVPPGSAGVSPGQAPKPLVVPPPGNAGVSPRPTPKPLVVPPGSAGVSPGQTPKPLVVPFTGNPGVLPGQSPKPGDLVPPTGGNLPGASPKPQNTEPRRDTGFPAAPSTRAVDLLPKGAGGGNN